MFHWICPECGREIAPGVKECQACDPQAAIVEPVLVQEEPLQIQEEPVQVHGVQSFGGAVQVLVPEIVDRDPEARLRELVGSMHGMAPGRAPESAAPKNGTPTTNGVRPLSLPSSSLIGPPAMVRMLTPKIPDIADRLDDPTLREPEAAAPPAATVLGTVLELRPSVARCEAIALPPVFEPVCAPVERAPHAAELENIEDQMASGIEAAPPPTSVLDSTVEFAEHLQGPRLPHELVSLEGAGISRVLRVVPEAPRPPLGSNIPGWVITSLVTATLLAGCLSLAFYTVPGLASPSPKAAPAPVVVPVEVPPTGSALVEVTGIRIVAGTGKGPEIRYLVVNHSAGALDGATVNVTLRLYSDPSAKSPISRFSFTAPGLKPYESREMVSPIQNLVSASQIPDWREVRADVQVAQ